jgi:hypothetical protein
MPSITKVEKERMICGLARMQEHYINFFNSRRRKMVDMSWNIEVHPTTFPIGEPASS